MSYIAVIVLHYGSGKDSKDCLDSLIKVTGMKDTQIIIVDNSSSATLAQELHEYIDQIKLLKPDKNDGFAAGINAGLKYALKSKARYFLVFNNDTVVSPDLVRKLSLFAQKNPTAGLISPKIYFAKGFEYHSGRYKASERGNVLWYAGGNIDWNNIYASHRGVDEVDSGQFNITLETDFATGCCMLINRDVLEKVELLDERYFLYFEDVDFSMKVKKSGFRVLYFPHAHLWHKNAASSGKPGSSVHIYYQTRNRLYFGMKYASFNAQKSLFFDSVRLFFRGGAFKLGVVDFYIRRMGQRTYAFRS